MDTMKLLLGATIALLLGALAVSWQGMKSGVRNSPPDEIARLEKQVKELRAEQDKLQLEKQMQQLRGSSVDMPLILQRRTRSDETPGREKQTGA